ncbi:MAG TPA: type I 3-dehydroquinate dehydratase [Chthoniobacterales bacterium]|jgi:3-dehydroquinate dehydratase-1|nr:type I 3-dehydroquinate dehydratase [Chthoniobacterales bacterium]
MRRPVKATRPQLVGVIASPADLRFAIAMRQPLDLFELRLDHLYRALDQLERKMSILSAPVIITARDPREGGANNLSLQKRLNLLLRFLPYAKYVDVELRSARAFKSLLARARKQNVRRILSFHNFKSTPSPRSLRAKASLAKAHGADIFKVATRIDTRGDLARLVDFVMDKDVDLSVSAMGIGKLGAISRLLLARGGSVLNYASLQRSQIEGQLPIELLRSALRR